MESSKLMRPLFYKGNFNRNSHKMRAVFEREISNGVVTYRLWRSAGKPDQEYPNAANDKYILYAECNGYLLPLKMTDCFLVNRCGFETAVKKLYGSNELRQQHFRKQREAEGDSGVKALLEKETKEIQRYGCDPVCQADYIQRKLDANVQTYLEAKENGGKTFPDFVGALILNDLANCAALSEVFKAQRREKETARLARAAQERETYCKEQNQKAEEAVLKAVQVLRTGGVLENRTVTLYRGQYDSSSYSIVNYLMRQYQVDVPLRTQGWINDKLANATIQDGKCTQVQYFRAKHGRGSQKVFECMNLLIQAVTAQVPNQQKVKKPCEDTY